MDGLDFRRTIFSRLLRIVRQDLDWCEVEGLSLVWTTGVGRTEIRVGAPGWIDDEPRVPVRVETEMVTGLVGLSTAAWQLERFDFPPGLSAPVLDRGLGRCLLVCTTYCGASETGEDLPILALAMLKQIAAHGLRTPLKDRMGGPLKRSTPQREFSTRRSTASGRVSPCSARGVSRTASWSLPASSTTPPGATGSSPT